MRVGALDVHWRLQWLQVTTGLVLPVDVAITSAQIGSLPEWVDREPLGGIVSVVYIRRNGGVYIRETGGKL